MCPGYHPILYPLLLFFGFCRFSLRRCFPFGRLFFLHAFHAFHIFSPSLGELFHLSFRARRCAEPSVRRVRQRSKEVLIVAPVVSRILAMAVSRKREYLADATGAQFTRNPMALATALEKLASASEATRSITRGAAHLCIVDPAPTALSTKEGFLADTLNSHPPIAQRIIRLKGMAYQQAKRDGITLAAS
jgi:Zn-dependent protease with chaperone function